MMSASALRGGTPSAPRGSRPGEAQVLVLDGGALVLRTPRVRLPFALALAILLLPLSAHAQDLSGSVDAEAFQPAPGPMDGFVVQRSTPEPHLAWSVPS